MTAASAGSVRRGARFLLPQWAYRVSVVGGGISTTGSVRARPVRGRPHWWVVLAVTLALMALVTAASTGHQARLGAQPYEATQSTGHATSTSTSTSTSTTAPQGETPTTGEPTSPFIEQSAAQSVPLIRTTSPTTTTAVPTATVTTGSTTTTSTTIGSGIGNSPLQNGAQSDQGYLAPPNDSAAIYSFNGDGATKVSASWTPQTELTMTVTCANGSQNIAGSASLELTLPDAQGACQVTLSEAAGETADVTFTLTIAPATNG